MEQKNLEDTVVRLLVSIAALVAFAPILIGWWLWRSVIGEVDD